MVQTIDSCEDLVAQIDAIGVEETVKAHRKPPLLTRILRDLYELYHDQDRYLSFLAHYPLVPSDLADQIASTLDPTKTEIAIGLAGNPRCPQQALHRLVSHPSAQVRHALAANPNLTPKEFHALVQDDNEFVRATLAQNSALPNPMQFVLANDSKSSVRMALTERKNLDSDVAVHLAEAEDPLVCAATVLNYSHDEEILQLWADNNQQRQQLLLLKRSKAIPSTAQQALRFSPHALVARSAMANTELNGPEMLFLAQSEDVRDCIFLAEQSHLPASIQRLLAQHPSSRVRCRLAANNSIHESIALHIVASNDIGACRTLAKNPATSDATLRELCQHPDEDIALLVAYRDDLMPEHYDLLLNHRNGLHVAEHLAYQEVEYKNFSPAVAEQLSQHEAPSLRAFVAPSAQLSDHARTRLLQDPCPRVREELAKNPALNEQQIRRLMEDSNKEVAFAAEAQFAQRIREQQAAKHNNESAASAEDTFEAEKTTSHQTEHRPRPRKGALFNKIANFFTE
jgi:hypothetical protein